MGKSELRAELIRFCDRIRNYEHESGHSIYQDERESSELVDIFLNDSHSTTEPEFDTLQEGDYVELDNISEYREILSINTFITNLESVANCCFSMKCIVFRGGFLLWNTKYKKTQLTAPEFIRRAENTFKKKNQ